MEFPSEDDREPMELPGTQRCNSAENRTSSKGGRTPVVGNAGDAVQKLLGICEQWGRLLRVITGGEDGDGAIGLQLPLGLRNELETCHSAVRRLYKRLVNLSANSVPVSRVN